ncbi:MAG: 5-formyltetrahydrofolate cyclo-ligase [Oscillospiraceae bacterium]|jgi:5-formyltetrahydrofolate cyclo-ligase
MKTDKQKLRDMMWLAQKALSPKEREASDDALFHQLKQFEPLHHADVVFAFIGKLPEPETTKWIEYLLCIGKTVAVPLCLEQGRMEARWVTSTAQLLPGHFGIYEPEAACPVVPKRKIDITLVPGVCFGRDGSRLGRGGGYYDRWLQGYHGVSVGICRSFCLLERIPVEAHDQTMDYVITEDEVAVIS